MRDGGTLKGDGADVLLGVFQALADSLGDFVGLAHAVTDAALAVADNAQSGELCNTAALNGLADTVEGNYLFDILGSNFFLIATITSVVIVCHLSFSPFLRTSGRLRGRLLPVP